MASTIIMYSGPKPIGLRHCDITLLRTFKFFPYFFTDVSVLEFKIPLRVDDELCFIGYIRKREEDNMNICCGDRYSCATHLFNEFDYVITAMHTAYWFVAITYVIMGLVYFYRCCWYYRNDATFINWCEDIKRHETLRTSIKLAQKCWHSMRTFFNFHF